MFQAPKITLGGDHDIIGKNIDSIDSQWTSIFFDLTGSKSDITKFKIESFSITNAKSYYISNPFSIKNILASEFYEMKSETINYYMQENLKNLGVWSASGDKLALSYNFNQSFFSTRKNLIISFIFKERNTIFSSIFAALDSSNPIKIDNGILAFLFDSSDYKDYEIDSPSYNTQISTYYPSSYGFIRILEIKGNNYTFSEAPNINIEIKDETKKYSNCYLIFNFKGEIFFRIPRSNDLELSLEMNKTIETSIFFYKSKLSAILEFSATLDIQDFISLEIGLSGLGQFSLLYKTAEMSDYQNIESFNIFSFSSIQSNNFTSYCTNKYTDLFNLRCSDTCPAYFLEVSKICLGSCPFLNPNPRNCSSPPDQKYFAINQQKISFFSSCPSEIPFFRADYQCLKYCPPHYKKRFNKYQCVKNCNDILLFSIQDEIECLTICPKEKVFYEIETKICSYGCPSTKLYHYQGMCMSQCPVNSSNVINLQCYDNCFSNQTFANGACIYPEGGIGTEGKVALSLILPVSIIGGLIILICIFRRKKKVFIGDKYFMEKPLQPMYKKILFDPRSERKNLEDNSLPVNFTTNQRICIALNFTGDIEEPSSLLENELESESEMKFIEFLKNKGLFFEIVQKEKGLKQNELKKLNKCVEISDNNFHIVVNKQKKKFVYKCLAENCNNIDVHGRIIYDFKHEIECLENLNYENILPILGFIYEKNPFTTTISYGIMMDLMDYDLNHLFQNSKKFTFVDKIQIAIQITKTIDYIHSKNLVHNDIKPENIFFNVTKKKLEVKIADFSLAEVIDKENPEKLSYLKGVTFLYTSPELFLIYFNNTLGKQCYCPNPKSDIWSLGLILFQIFIGDPFSKINYLTLLQKEMAESDVEKVKFFIEEDMKLEENQFLREEDYPSVNGNIVRLLNMCFQMRKENRSSAGVIIGLLEVIKDEK